MQGVAVIMILITVSLGHRNKHNIARSKLIPSLRLSDVTTSAYLLGIDQSKPKQNSNKHVIVPFKNLRVGIELAKCLYDQIRHKITNVLCNFYK